LCDRLRISEKLAVPNSVRTQLCDRRDHGIFGGMNVRSPQIFLRRAAKSGSFTVSPRVGGNDAAYSGSEFDRLFPLATMP
jgi:hypothetical protein